MSFITRVAPATRTSVAPVLSRAGGIAALRPAFFSTTVQRGDKGPVEATKETLKKADHAISSAAVKGIEKGEKASHKIKDTFGHASKKAEQEGGKAAKETKRKANDLEEEAKESAGEYTGKA